MIPPNWDEKIFIVKQKKISTTMDLRIRIPEWKYNNKNLLHARV